jgi:hypothetical protein
MPHTILYLSALLEDVAVSLVVVARCARLAVHVGHVEWRDVELEGGHTGTALSGLLAAQLTCLIHECVQYSGSGTRSYTP